MTWWPRRGYKWRPQQAGKDQYKARGTPAAGRIVAMGDEQLNELRSRLDDIAEEIADIGRAKLRQALDSDDAQAVSDERRLTRARRSVLKAAALLGGGEPSDEDS